MPVSFDCPHCGAHTEVADHFAGQTGPSAQCGATITIPGTTIGAPPVSSTKRGSSTSLVGVLVAVGVAGMCLIVPLLFALLSPAISRAPAAARKAQCKNNLKQIALADGSVHSFNGGFDPEIIRAAATADGGEPVQFSY